MSSGDGVLTSTAVDVDEPLLSPKTSEHPADTKGASDASTKVRLNLSIVKRFEDIVVGRGVLEGVDDGETDCVGVCDGVAVLVDVAELPRDLVCDEVAA